MAKRAGKLYVSLGADTAAFSRSMERAAKDVEAVSKKFEAVGRKGAMIGAAIALPIIGAIKAAASHSVAVKTALDKVERAFGAIAQEIATAFLPAIRAVASGVAVVAQWMHDLDPATKKIAVTVIEVAVAAAVLVAALGQVAGIVSSYEALQLAMVKMGTTIGAVAGGVLIAIAVIGALILIAGFVREAWDENLGGIREKFAAVWKWITEKVATIKDAFRDALKFVVSIFATAVGKLASLWEGFGELIGQDFSGSAGFLKDISSWIESFGKGDNSLGAVWDDFTDAAGPAMTAVGKIWDMTVDGMKKNLKSVTDLLPNGTGMMLPQDVTVGEAGNAQGISQHFMGDIAQQSAETGLGKKFRETTDKIALDAAKTVEEAVQGLANKFAARLGTAGELLGTAMQGAQAGGPWGALIAVFVDLVTRSKQFNDALAYVEDGLKMVADTFGRLFGSGSKVNEASNKAISGLMDFIGPIFDALSDAFGNLAPVIDGLAAVIKPILDVVGEILKPALSILGVFLKAIAGIILMVIRGIAGIWNLIIEAVAGIIGIFDQDKAWEFRSKKINTKPMDDALKDLMSATTDNTQAQKDQAEAVDKATAALLNVPSGFKVGLARFNSIVDGAGGPGAATAAATSSGTPSSSATPHPKTPDRTENGNDHVNRAHGEDGREGERVPRFAAGGVVTRPTLALIGEAGPEAVVPLSGGGGGGLGGVTINVFGITDPEVFARKLADILRRKSFQGAA